MKPPKTWRHPHDVHGRPAPRRGDERTYPVENPFADPDVEKARLYGLMAEIAQDREQPARAMMRNRAVPRLIASKHMVDDDLDVVPPSLVATLSDLLIDADAWRNLVKDLQGEKDEKSFLQKMFSKKEDSP